MSIFSSGFIYCMLLQLTSNGNYIPLLPSHMDHPFWILLIGWFQTWFLRNPKNQNFRTNYFWVQSKINFKKTFLFFGGMACHGIFGKFQKQISKLVVRLSTLQHEDFQKALFIEFWFLIDGMELSITLEQILPIFQNVFSHQKL